MRRWKGDKLAQALLRMGRGDALALSIWSLIVGVACVAVGVVAFRQVVSAYWPRTDGIVTVSERDRGPTRGDGGAAIALADYDDLRDSEALANWLRQQLCDQPGAGKWAKT